MRIAISTIAFKDYTVEEIIAVAEKERWMIEFSSGLAYQAHLKDLYLKADIERLPHNYFPPPQDPFVLNLASLDKDIRERSVNHCIQGMRLAAASNSPFFSAHAGFCGDPNPEELGRKIEFKSGFNRTVYWENFIKSINDILKQAKVLGIDFLIENNVCAKFNLTSENENPLLCAEPEEILKLFREINNTALGLLLDTAHLKVSSKALGFDLDNSVTVISNYVKAIHHSDNEGQIDTNDRLTDDYWFLPLINIFKDIIHVLEVKNISVETIKQQIELIK